MADADTTNAGALRAEWRAEEAAWSRAAFECWEHGRTLADVLRDSSGRGDTVVVELASTTWVGTVAAVGDDVVRLAVGPLPVDVRLSADAPFVVRTRPDDRPGTGSEGIITTFLARLRELDGTDVCIGTAAGALEGSMRVGREQVRLVDADGACAYVPTGSLWWVRPLDAD
jgi:hypothetical protein